MGFRQPLPEDTRNESLKISSKSIAGEGAAPGRLLSPSRQKVGILVRIRCFGVLLLLVVFGFGSAWAVDPATLISQYAHSTWHVADGTIAGSPNTIAQTSDGYMWIGTELGLVRFDGARFVQWNPPSGERLLDSRIYSLLGTEDGSLWIGTNYGLYRWKDGKLTNFAGLSGRVEALVEDNAGSIWLARTRIVDTMGPVCRVRDGQLTCFGTDDKVPFANVLQLASSREGYLWLAGYSEVSRWKPGVSVEYFRNQPRKTEGIPLFKAITTGPDGSIWAVISGREPVLHIQHFVQGSWISQAFPAVPVENSQITALFVDPTGALWIGTSLSGFFRVQDGHTEHYDRTDGLSSNSILKFYQDVEGTLWVVTSAGIDNFRDLHVLSYSMRQGLASDGAISVVASRDGGLWVLSNYYSIQKLTDGKFVTILPRPGMEGHVSVIFEDHSGTLLIGFENGLYGYRDGAFYPVLRDDGAQLGLVFSMTEDAHHHLWVRDGPYLDELSEGRVVRELTSPQIPTGYILTALPDGSVALGLVSGDLLVFRDGTAHSIPSNETGNTSQIRDLAVDPDGTLWGTTMNELVSWKDGVRRNLTVRNGLPCEGIFALLEDESHGIWLYSRCGLIRIARSELDRWWRNPDVVVQTKLLDEGDGVQPGLTSLKPQAARTSDGRLWFANGRVVQVFDPAHEHRNAIPPSVQIEGVIADREPFSPADGLRLPPVTRDLEIEYTALSYVAPQKVFFRYRLEGRDTRWQEPGGRREAFYSDLGPGRYRFHVIACNNDGVWNEVGTMLAFSIAPAWYQTLWFQAACAALILGVVWIVYRLRVRQIALAMNQRFDERLDERTRLARDLHDTLLQTIQGSKMVADDALEQSADPVRMRHALEKLSDWMGQATVEGRAALQSLRASTTERNDLAEALRRATESDLIPASMSVNFSVAGPGSEMHPIVRDEIYRISYEAIRNAAVHSGASRLDVELRYAQDLTVRVRDNGVGIDPEILDRGRPGHFGVQGMRERSARIGGKLTVMSSGGGGTEFQLVVPGGIIFQRASPRRLTLLARIFNGFRAY
ncbi:MAG TPA: two-component regulator propeller domain-containing protein [Silvibacterium sp.]|nr:two-component regulator propeller domain-containing protein [Silvibacterium sp.]